MKRAIRAAILPTAFAVLWGQPAARKPFQAQSSSTINYGVAKDGLQTIEIVNTAYEVSAPKIPGHPADELLVLRKTIRSREVLGDMGVESAITLETWPLGAELKQKPLYVLTMSGVDARTLDNALWVAARGLEEVEWWSVYKLGTGQHLLDTYVPLLSFSISRAEQTLRYVGLEVPPDDTADARLKDPHVVAVLTYASADRVIREALVTCDDVKRAPVLRSFADATRSVTHAGTAATQSLRIAFSRSYPSAPATVTVTIPIVRDDLDVAHAQLPAGLHATVWKR